MNTIVEFKESLERSLGIIQWNPTQADIQRIAARIVDGAQTAEGVLDAVAVVVPDRTSFVTEGVDNSDLRALLALAAEVVRKAGSNG